MGYVMFDENGCVHFRREPNIKKKTDKKKFKRLQKIRKNSKRKNRR